MSDSELSKRLAHARPNGGTVLIATDEASADLEPAYALQQAVLAHVGKASHAWKVGSTSAAARARLGSDQPGAGRVPTRFLLQSPATLAVFAEHQPQAELEIALRLGRALPPREAEYTLDEVRAAVD